jgi:hypothetical protein
MIRFKFFEKPLGVKEKQALKEFGDWYQKNMYNL